MPSLSPGTDKPSSFEHLLPGSPVAGHQSLTTLTYRWKKYIFYISGKQLNILRGPTELVQALHFDHDLVALQAEGTDGGRLAMATTQQAYVLRPTTDLTNSVTWIQELVLSQEADNRTSTLSWGTEGELLVGGIHKLSLYGTLPSSRAASPTETAADVVDIRSAQWSRPVASPLGFAAFSPSSHLIASTGQTDRLVKIWRRLSYEEAIFDFAYLPHSRIVTHLEWRPMDMEKLEALPDDTPGYHGPDDTCEVLYTLCADGTMSIWRTNGHTDLDIMSLYTIIDLVSAIPHSPVLTTAGKAQRPVRYAFVIPASAYDAAVSVALKRHPKQQLRHAIEHLKEVSSKEPDVIVVLDAQGRMSAWGLSSVGHKRRPGSGVIADHSPFHIAHSESLGLDFEPSLPSSFHTWFDGDILNILSHSYSQSIKWWRGTVENFSSSAALDFDRGEQIAIWQGCGELIDVLRTTPTADGLLACSGGNTITEWSVGDQHQFEARKRVAIDSSVLDVDLVQRSKSLLAVDSAEATLARCVDGKGRTAVKHSIDSTSGLQLLRLEGTNADADELYLVYNGTGQYATISVNPTRHDWQSQEQIVQVTGNGSLPLDDEGSGHNSVQAVLHPRKSGWLRLVGLDTRGNLHRRDVAVAALSQSSKAKTEPALSFATGLDAGRLISTSSCAALLSADGKGLAILDLKEGYIEHKQTLLSVAKHVAFPRQSSDKLSEHSCVAIGYHHTVDILLRSRYDHSHHSNEPHWTLVESISIHDTGMSIAAISWLSQSRLAVAAGNSIFVMDSSLNTATLSNIRRQELELRAEQSASIDGVVGLLRAPRTCWQPQVLRQLILHGHFQAVVNILLQLQSKLRFYSDGDTLDSLLDLNIDELLTTSRTNEQDLDLAELGDQLDELDLPFTSDEDQEKLKLVAQMVAYVNRHSQSLDLNAIRYLAHWRYHVLLELRAHQQKQNGTLTNGNSHNDHSEHKAVPQMGWREVNFAYHSTTQQPLLNILVEYYENKLDWDIVRALGITLWLHNIRAAQSEGAPMASLEQIFDALGQNAFRASYPPNPADASLFLLALRKKAVLLSLWRMAVGNREQKSTQNFLQRDFSLEEHKTAARKNAYALMGKRRFQYAAAFFLLADDVVSAISILAGQLEDLPLAMSVARAYCGEGTTLIQDFIKERIISLAKKDCDRWMLSWGYATMSDHAQVLHALVAPVQDLCDEPPVRKWQQDDPVTLTIYHELREKAKRSVVAQLSSQIEYRAVLRAARVLRHLGYWLLALRLVQTWSFVEESAAGTQKGVQQAQQDSEVAFTPAAPSMLDGYDTAPVETAVKPTDAEDRAAKAAALLAKMREKKAAQPSEPSAPNGKKAPTQFTEPSASSLLDSFGF